MKYLYFIVVSAMVILSTPSDSQMNEHRGTGIVEFQNNRLSETYIVELENEYYGAVLDAIPVQFNTDVFNRVALKHGDYYRVDKGSLSGQEVTLPMPNGGKALTLVVTAAQNLIPKSNVVTYSGHVKGDTHARFVFAVDGEKIHGQLSYQGLAYKLHEAGKHQPIQVMSVISPQLMPRDSEEDVSSGRKKTNESPYRSSGAGGNVRVLFLYASNVTNPAAKISTLVSDHNEIMALSGVDNNRYISVADTQLVNSTFSTSNNCKGDIIDNMEGNDNEFTGLNNQMQTARADYAYLIVNGPAGHPSCGFSSLPNLVGHIGGQVADQLNSLEPYGMVADNYLGYAADHTGVHEMGHLLGGYHPGQGEPNETNEGVLYDNPTNKWQSIMGSYQGLEGDCNFVSPTNDDCLRIPRFSNPNRTYWVTGDPLGVVGVSDMTSYLDYSVPVAGNFEPNPFPQPPAPTGLNVVSSQCYGINGVSWSSVSSANHYRLYRSNNANFYQPELVYSGGSTSTIINVTSGTAYLRVRACNDAGCDVYSSQQSASRVNYCL